MASTPGYRHPPGAIASRLHPSRSPNPPAASESAHACHPRVESEEYKDQNIQHRKEHRATSRLHRYQFGSADRYCLILHDRKTRLCRLPDTQITSQITKSSHYRQHRKVRASHYPIHILVLNPDELLQAILSIGKPTSSIISKSPPPPQKQIQSPHPGMLQSMSSRIRLHHLQGLSLRDQCHIKHSSAPRKCCDFAGRLSANGPEARDWLIELLSDYLTRQGLPEKE